MKKEKLIEGTDIEIEPDDEVTGPGAIESHVGFVNRYPKFRGRKLYYQGYCSKVYIDARMEVQKRYNTRIARLRDEFKKAGDELQRHNTLIHVIVAMPTKDKEATIAYLKNAMLAHAVDKLAAEIAEMKDARKTIDNEVNDLIEARKVYADKYGKTTMAYVAETEHLTSQITDKRNESSVMLSEIMEKMRVYEYHKFCLTSLEKIAGRIEECVPDGESPAKTTGSLKKIRSMRLSHLNSSTTKRSNTYNRLQTNIETATNQLEYEINVSRRIVDDKMHKERSEYTDLVDDHFRDLPIEESYEAETHEAIFAVKASLYVSIGENRKRKGLGQKEYEDLYSNDFDVAIAINEIYKMTLGYASCEKYDERSEYWFGRNIKEIRLCEGEMYVLVDIPNKRMSQHVLDYCRSVTLTDMHCNWDLTAMAGYSIDDKKHIRYIMPEGRTLWKRGDTALRFVPSDELLDMSLRWHQQQEAMEREMAYKARMRDKTK